MEFLINNSNPTKQHCDCLVVGVFEDQILTPAAQAIDSLSDGTISKLVKRGDISGKVAQTLFLYDLPKIACERILLVGCGKNGELTEKQYKKIIVKAIATLNDASIKEAVCYLSELEILDRDGYWSVRQAVESTQDSLYRFDQFKTKADKTLPSLVKLTFNVIQAKDLEKAKLALSHALAISVGTSTCKDVANMPPNVCTPFYLAEQAKSLDDRFEKITTEVLDTAQMIELKMGSYLAVAQGSVNPAYMSVIKYNGGPADQKPIILVGKGITFDSGGISLKPGAGMDEMKYDMGGAASVLGTMTALSELNLPINVIGVLAAAENMPSGKAYRPGDILTSMSGQTIEVLNTDAEGRLVLCDALTYVERFDPACVIDIATLTGAVIVALGHDISGLVATNDELASDLLFASKEASDQAWLLPINDDYQSLLDSPFADMNNSAGRAAGTITAACFLSRFTKNYKWAHVDCAGTAWKSGANKGSTGRPVSLLTQFLINKAG
jgi:leucyl aminopeptidase